MSNDNNTTNNDWSEREIGALWKRSGSNQKYLSGKLKMADGSTQEVVVFTNKYKNADNQPDFRVYKSAPNGQQQTQQQSGGQTEVVEEGIL
jgi:uncharacterized protein (DUF736 family)